jgi:ABC-2 type transport system ATP-binding protein
MVGQRDRITLAASGDLAAGAAAARRLPSVEDATAREDGLDLLLSDARTVLPRVLETVADAGVEVRSVEVVEPDLEAVFLHLTGKALRD